MNKSIIIAAGGTAGHVYPAIAIIEHILNEYPDTEVTFIGTRKGMEKKLLADLNVRFEAVRASGFSVSANFFKKIFVYLTFIYNFISGFFTSLNIIKSTKAGFVLGMGGYVCAPVFMAAVVSGKKIAIHEQNFIPGRLNKYFSRFAKYIFISFKDSEEFFKKLKPKKNTVIIHTGNPLRASVRNYYKLKPDYKNWNCVQGRKTIVAFGGSLGAQKINNSISGLYERLRDNKEMQIILISGSRFYNSLSAKINEIKKEGDSLILNIYPYIPEIDRLYRIADIIISRAGATTVAELDYTMIYSILIPYPHAIDNHQYYNAGFLVKNNRAVLINDDQLNEERLEYELKNLLKKQKAGINAASINMQHETSIKNLKTIIEKILEI
ncbi:MAG: UDP-N-acetylglucosamine--N-acetylmuramyl-(pentapeptide) pyrophosphoryl-undecaprenol N-acetylglucosamine transferase [Actinobacteria bacterium]|nr:UDP-N-acetylglucosamine--N-acetylmuramyl-(pentapeptide) pyrophosphoryl-undecaprenol N-acetylglucosamine transferase [Actinomycetota bacterium]